MTELATPPKLQFLDSNGAPLVGGKLYTYAAGTTTPLATYTDFGGGTANANPVILDSRGEASVWLGTSIYKMALYSATNVLIWTVDNIGGFANLAQLAASGGSNLVGFLQAGTGAVATTVQAKLRESVSVKDFGAVGDGVTDDTAAIQAAVNAAVTVEFPDGTYLISSNITLARHNVLMASKPRAATIKSMANRALLVQGAATNTPTTAADVEFRGLGFEGVSITLADYVYWLRVIDCAFGAGTVTANTYNPLSTVTPTVAIKTRIENAEVSGNRFVNVRRAVYLYHGFGDINVRDNYINTAAQSGIWISTLEPNDLTTCDRANVLNNTVINVGANATETYINAIDVYARNATVIGNAVRNVKNVSYWEVDGIYVKAQEAVINDNEVYNGGYRSNIQTKQMGSDGGSGLNNGQIPTYSIVIAGNSIYIDETAGFAGSHTNLLANYVGKVFGGINIVTDNTLVSNNIIAGAGIGIYGLNSFANWLINNTIIENNTIVNNRAGAAILWGHAGKNLVIDGNKIVAPNNAFAMTIFRGVQIQYNSSDFIAVGAGSWINTNPNYLNRRTVGLQITDNFVTQSLSLSGTIAPIYLAVSDSSMGGSYPTYPGSFENCIIRGNIVQGSNGGAGDGFGIYVVDEVARYSNLDFTSANNSVIEYKTAAYFGPTGYVVGTANALPYLNNTSRLKSDSTFRYDGTKAEVLGVTANSEYFRAGNTTSARGLRFSSFEVGGSFNVGHKLDAPGDGGTKGTLYLATNSTDRIRMGPNGDTQFVGLASAPTPQGAGSVYYDTTTNKLRCWNGSTWNDLF